MRRNESLIRTAPSVVPPRRPVVLPKSTIKYDITVMCVAVAQCDHAEAQAAFSHAQGFVTQRQDADADEPDPQQSWHLCDPYLVIISTDTSSTNTSCIAAVSSHVLSPSLTLCFYDNACSYHTTNCMSLLTRVEPITHFEIGGIGSGVKVTHKGFLSFLPPAFGLCYFTPSSAITSLISLGYLVCPGGTYRPDVDSPGSTTLRFSCGSFLGISPLTANNLSPISFCTLLLCLVLLIYMIQRVILVLENCVEQMRQKHFTDFPIIFLMISAVKACKMDISLVLRSLVGISVTIVCFGGKMHNRSFRASPSFPPVHSDEELYIDVVKFFLFLPIEEVLIICLC